GVGAHASNDAQNQVLWVFGDHFKQRHFTLIRFVLQLLEDRGLVDLHADNQTNEHQYGTQQERNTPAPANELLIRQQGEHTHDDGGEHGTGRTAHIGETRGETTTLLR